MAAQQLDPGSGDHPPHGEAQQIDGLVKTKGRLDLGVEERGRGFDGGEAKPQRQLGDQQHGSRLAQGLQQPVKDLRGVPEAVEQDQGMAGIRLG